MIDFAVIVNRAPDFAGGGLSRPQRSFEALAAELVRSRPYDSDETISWTSSDRRIEVAVLHSSLPPFRHLSELVRVDPDGSMSLFWGHATFHRELIRSVDHWIALGAPQVMQGDYVAWRLNVQGRGEILRPPVSMHQIYHAQKGAVQVVSSRASMAARCVDIPVSRVSRDFVRWLAGYAVAGNTSSLVEDVEMVRMDRRVSISSAGIHVGPQRLSTYCDPVLRAEYERDAARYWDETFELLCDSAKVLDLTEDEIEFPLSGGRDSRLLLGLVRQVAGRRRFKRVFTNGPSVSPEVRSAQMVCHALGLPHDHVDNTAVVRPTAFPVTSRLPAHLAITEGEMTPVDLTFETRRRSRTQLWGQEGGLRNIARKARLATAEQARAWFQGHLGRGDPLGVLHPHVAAASMEEVDDLIGEFAAADIPHADWPSLHRVLFRLSRWVGRSWKNYNSIMFAPYLFTTTDVVRRTLSAGAESRSLEEFHFQMLMRLDRRLIELPFAGQRWDDKLFGDLVVPLTNPDPLAWPEGTAPHAVRPMFDATVRHWPRILDYLRQDRAWLAEVLNWDIFDRLNPEALNVAMYQRLWQVLQCSVAHRNPEWDRIECAADIAAALPNLDLA